MRKWFTYLFAGLWLLAAQSASAQCSFTGFGLKIESIAATQGQQVCLDVTTQSFTNLFGMQFSIQYNPAVLQFVNITGANPSPLGGLTAGNFSTQTAGVITATWDDPLAQGNVTLPDGTVIFQMCFNVVGNTTTTVSFGNMPTPIEIINGSLQVIPFSSCPGTVTLPGGGGSPTPLGLTVESITAAQGQQVCLDLRAQNFTNLTSAQLSLQYNSTMLQFVNATNFSLSGLTAASFGNPTPGALTLNWTAPGGIGVTRPANTVIAELCFTIIGATTSTVSFTNSPVATAIQNGSQQQVTLNGTSGTVTVSGGGNPSSCNITGFGLEIESANGTQGQQVCLDVSTRGFTNILGMQFTMDYNPAVLQFANIAGVNPSPLNGLTAGGFGTGTPGKITLTWDDPLGQGNVTLPNSTVIFQVCFNVVGNTTTMVSFSNTPTPIEIVNGSLQVIPFSSCPGTVTLSGGGGNPSSCNITGFGLEIESANGTQGQQVCLDVSTRGFTNILGMQFTMDYNPAILQFASIAGVNPSPLSGLTSGGFGTGTPGKITLTWDDPLGQGNVTLPNNTVIFQVCFNVVGNTTTTVTFGSTPTPIEIVSGSLQVIPFSSCPGTVTLGGGGSPTPLGLTVESITTTQGQQVCLDLRAQNFTDLTSVQLSLQYNSAILQFVNTTNFSLSGLTAASFGNPTPGVLTLNWSAPGGVGVTRPNNTVIAELCFTVVGTTTSNVSFSNSPVATAIQNGSQQQVTLNGTNGTVTVSAPSTCDITGFGLEIESANGTQGQQVCLDVTTHGFTNIFGMQFTIDYNPAMLQFASIAGANPSPLNGLTAGNFGTGTPGKITLTWDDPLAQGNVTLPDGTVIFQLCFNVVGNATTMVAFGNTPTPIEIVNGSLQVIPFDSCPGTVTLGGGGNPTTCDITGFGLEIESANGTQGQQVCLDVTTHGFTNIFGMQFTIDYNPAMLQFASIAGANPSPLNGLTAGSFGTGTPGKITLTWDDPLAQGNVTLPDGTVIFQLCFNVVGNATTTVTFGNTPTPIEIVNSSLQVIPFDSCPGTVTLGGGGNPTTPCDCEVTGFGLEIEDASVMQGQQVCLDVTTHGFTNIFGAQFTIQYDPAVLQFVSIAGVNPSPLSGLTAGNFGTNTPGLISMTWDDPLAQGNVTLPDCSVIFQMCFNVLSCSNTTVTFGDNPTPIEIVNNALQVIPFTSCPGTVSCGTQQQGPTIANANITNVACRGQSTGAITVQATGPGTLSYAWSVAGAGNTPTITGRPAGTYSVTVTSSSGGTPATATYTITQPATAVTINNITATDVSCEGGDDGSILVSASGGTGTLSYAWSAPPPNPGNTPNAMNLIPFSFYRVTVTDASGCTAVSMLTEIEEPTAIVVTAMSIQNVLCAGASTGAITLGVTGGTGPYTYNWSGTAPDTNPTTGLPAGVYSVTVTDSRSCTQTLNNINVVSLNPAVAITNTAVTDLNDGNPGAVNITVQGGSGTYTYVWTGPGGFSASTQDISNLATGGQYCVTVTDGNGCTTNTCATVGEDLAITTFSINKACSGTSDGDVDITVSGGTAPYTYQWRNSSNALMTGTPQDLVNVAPGTYNVTVSDANSNTVTGSFEVTSFPAINIASNIGSATSGNNGSVALTLTGGTPPFTVVWSGTNQTGPSINNLAVGQYCATITDANFCTATGCYMVTAQPFAIGTVTPTNVLCNGATTGTLAVNVLGGTPPYTLTINSTPYNSANGAFNITGLGANNWAFTVTDNTGALLNSNATITQPAAITATSTINHDTEDPGCTGSITLNISGGTPGYTVLWNGPVGPQIISLCEGNYIPTIQDANGCNVTLPAIALNTFSEAAVSANVDCPTDEDGSINLTVTGGNTPYTFEWKNAGGVVVSDDEDLANATPGTYTVRITDASGLVLVRQYTVTAQSNFSVSPQVTSNYSNFAVSCADATDGSAVANITGSGEFDVVWESNGNTFVGATLQNAGPGSYTATVTDELGCEVTASLTLNAPSPLTLNANVIAVSCLDDKNGEIQVFASGGIPGIYQYQWSNGIFGNQVRFLGAGNYTVTATDLNGCEKVETYALADPTPILVTFDIEPATEGFNGTVRAIVSGGQMPYRYEWVNLNSSDFSSVVSSLAPGEYYLIVTDDNGCRTSTLTAVVPDERYPCLEERVVITPDGNGANDEFIIFCIGDLPNNNLEIYNRWGQLVFETENYDNTWAGTSQNGSPLPDGPYYYVLEYTNPDGTPVQAKGSLTIVRE